MFRCFVGSRKRCFVRAPFGEGVAGPAFPALRVCSFFCFAKRKNQRKGDFFPKAPPEKKGPTLVTHRAIGLGGASFGPMGKFYGTASMVLAFREIGQGQPHLRPKRCPIMCWALGSSVSLDFK